MTNKTSKKDRVLTYLSKGNTITETQARTKFGLRNLRATISDLREEGKNFKLVKQNGKPTKYQLATKSRKSTRPTA